MSRLSNFYIPWRSSRLVFSKSFKLSNKLSSMEEVKDDDSWEHLSLVGISDAALQNHVYRQVLFELELVELEMDDLILLIKQMLQDKYKNIDTNKSFKPINIDYDFQKLNSKVDFMDVDPQIIYLWKSDKYSISSIALKTQASKELVNESISKYKRGVRNLWRMNRRNNKTKRRKITETHIEAIKDFVNSMQNQPITIRKIKKQLSHHILKLNNHLKQQLEASSEMN